MIGLRTSPAVLLLLLVSACDVPASDPHAGQPPDGSPGLPDSSRPDATADERENDAEAPPNDAGALPDAATQGDSAVRPLACAPTHELPGWSSADLPRGADPRVSTLAIHPGDPNILYAGTWGNGVLRSADGGATWEPYGELFSPHIIFRLGVATDGSVFALELRQEANGIPSDRLFKRSPSDTRWQVLASLHELTGYHTNFDEFVLDPSDPDHLFVNSWSSYESHDGGQSWTHRADLPGAVQVIVPGDVPVLLGWSAGGIWRLQGDVLSEYAPLEGTFSSMHVAPGHPDTLYASLDWPEALLASHDGGLTWEKVSEWSYLRSLWIDPADPLHILGQTSHELFESDDGGKSSVLWPERPEAFAADFENDRYFSGSQGIARSGPRGDGLTPSTMATSAIEDLAVDPSGNVYIASRAGIHVRASGDGSFLPVYAAGEGLTVSIDASQSATAYFGVIGLDPVSDPFFPQAQLWRSTDGGRTTELLRRGVREVAVAESNPTTLYRCGGQLEVSLDRGLTFGAPHELEHLASPCVVDPTRDEVAFAAQRGACAQRDVSCHAPGAGSAVHETRDRGASWQETLTGLWTHDVAIARDRPDTVFLATEQGLYRRESPASSFQAFRLGGEHLTAVIIDRSHPELMAAGTIDGKVFLSINRGDTWREVVSPEGGPVRKLALTPACPRNLLVATPRGLFEGALVP